MGVRIRERNGAWWVFVNHRGKRKAKKVGDRRAAQEVARKLEARLAAGDFAIDGPAAVSYADLCQELRNDYAANGKALWWLEGRLKHLDRAFGKCRASEITTTAIRAYVLQRKGEGAANSTVNRELALIRRMFTLGKQAGTVSDVPYVPRLRENNVRQGFFEWEDFRRLRDELPEYLRGYLTFAYYTGWRKRRSST